MKIRKSWRPLHSEISDKYNRVKKFVGGYKAFEFSSSKEVKIAVSDGARIKY
jgi:hypothetical protein